jgi:hypothetical protein
MPHNSVPQSFKTPNIRITTVVHIGQHNVVRRSLKCYEGAVIVGVCRCILRQASGTSMEGLPLLTGLRSHLKDLSLTRTYSCTACSTHSQLEELVLDPTTGAVTGVKVVLATPVKEGEAVAPETISAQVCGV